MPKCAALLAFAGILMAADPPKNFFGVVYDHSRMQSTPAQQCAVIKGPKYTLQTSDGAWILADEKLAAPYAGKKVKISGTLSDGNKLHIVTIAPTE